MKKSTQIIGSVLMMLKNNLRELNETQVLGYNSAEWIVLEKFSVYTEIKEKKNAKKRA